MNKTRNSALNAVFALVLTLNNGLLGIIVTRLIIGEFGSDFNGLNSTANQIINVLLILEGGFTLASNVALFDPLGRADYKTVNGVLAATRFAFHKIGILFLGVGILASFVYSCFANTSLEQGFVFAVVLMAVIPQAVNLYFATIYRVLLQTQQREYIISGFTALTISLGHLMNIFIVSHGGQMWMVRFVTMVFAVINCVFIIMYAKRKNGFINFKEEARPDLINGIHDVMAQKITGVIYTSWPIVFLSVSSNGGTVIASVYSVYNSIFVMIKALLHSVIDAPRLSFGQLLTERGKRDIWNPFHQYELLAVLFTFIAMISVSGVIMPFIKLYTSGVGDTNYYDMAVAILMTVIGTVEMLHIPSGHLINMSGNFRISKNFQISACVVLIISMAVLGGFFGVYGMLWALLAVAVLLAVLEIGYVHTVFFRSRLKSYMKMCLPFLLIGGAIAFWEMRMSILVESWSILILYGIIIFVINFFAGIMISCIFDKDSFLLLVNKCFYLLKKK